MRLATIIGWHCYLLTCEAGTVDDKISQTPPYFQEFREVETDTIEEKKKEP